MKWARVILLPFEIFVMTPPRVWKETHNYHHNHTAQLVGSNIGSFATMTLSQRELATPAERRHYRIVRHPLTVLFAYFTPFILDICLMSFLRSPRKPWALLPALSSNWASTIVI